LFTGGAFSHFRGEKEGVNGKGDGMILCLADRREKEIESLSRVEEEGGRSGTAEKEGEAHSSSSNPGREVDSRGGRPCGRKRRTLEGNISKKREPHNCLMSSPELTRKRNFL